MRKTINIRNKTSDVSEDRFLEEYIIITENRNSKIKSKTNYLLFVATKESILFGLPTIKPNLFSK